MALMLPNEPENPAVWKPFLCPKCKQGERFIVTQFVTIQVHRFAKRAKQTVLTVYTCQNPDSNGDPCNWQTEFEKLSAWLTKATGPVRNTSGGSKDDWGLVKP
jgi:hypothetical protein